MGGIFLCRWDIVTVKFHSPARALRFMRFRRRLRRSKKQASRFEVTDPSTISVGDHIIIETPDNGWWVKLGCILNFRKAPVVKEILVVTGKDKCTITAKVWR